MYLLKPTITVFALLCLCSCRQQQENNIDTPATAQNEAAPAQLRFDIKTVQRTSGDCGPDSSTCAKVNITYPVAVAGPNNLKQSINRYVEHRLQSMKLDFNPDADTTSTGNAASDLADFFLKQRQHFVEDMETMPDMPAAMAGWALQVNGNPIYTSPGVTSLRFEIFYNTGGAHPNAYNVFQSFDSTGRQLTLPQMVTDTARLKALTEKEFREVRNIAGDKLLVEAGLFVSDNQLPLPQNAALTRQGLLLYYNPYEIGPWAFGDTELLLPYAQLQDLLQPAYRQKTAQGRQIE
ncbi:DUF3298 domain-containing protein [Pontibacter sp. 172403-2]|uniref:DUF3298 and DUF4163 domain-containing protein n=1 Tax=Pontibacter rufus TaxID=2791028 RepID=UPI0018AFB0AB|nr:DUF3298 and DUF4163 domain-containing protein [Pontibacter sp. 172403-2]MBF9254329.1 DUF3298 domain-containing protein [Pontibacter sp. 172403-2]